MHPKDIFLATLVTVIWGFNFVVIHIGIEAFPPLMFSALRFVLAAFPLVFLLPKPDVRWSIIVSIGMVLGVVKFGFLFIGMDVGLSAGLASLVLQSQAFFTIILALIIYRERPVTTQLFGMAVAFSGIGIVATTLDSNASVTGFSLVLVGAFAWAVSNLLIKKAGAVNMLHLMVWISLIPPIPLLFLSLFFEGWDASKAALAALDAKGIGAVLYISYFATVLGFAAWGRLIRQYGAGSIAPFSLLVPVFGMASSAIMLDEDFGTTRLIACIFVILGLALTVTKPATIGAIVRRNRSREG